MRTWIVGVLAVLVLAVGAWAFQPWRLWTSSTVDEPVPTAITPTPTPTPTTTQSPTTSPAPDESTAPSEAPPPAQDVVLATGRFEDAEHGTTGTARILELADGRRFLRLQQLATSDGPDLHVWLSDQPSGGDWNSYDDDKYVRLGKLKATNGNQNYEIPASAQLRGMRSVVIWCDRFNVAFGTAAVDLTKA